MRIGEVAAKAGVSVRALRYYEQQDLLHSTRNPGGQRQYPADAVERVRLIQRLYSEGLPSRTIREILPFADSGKVSPELLELLGVERDRMDRQIADLWEARNRLDDCITEAREQDRHLRHPPAGPLNGTGRES
ncbi:MerR family transcriptional regulator [Marinactinospora rubrisoli]|uniref:MerR family transcriptional regulator n=1 Tax=Marinactinospora rubrisoli TaxID=2715399 RepID=A0ABW2KPR7_9ACTN